MLFNGNKIEKNADENPEMRYVEPDESRTVEKDDVVKKGILSASHKWARQSQIMEIEGIYGNREFQLKVEGELELQLKETLDMWGLELLKFTSEWDLGDYTKLARVRGIETYKLWKQTKTEARRAEVGIDQDVADKEHARDIERTKTVLEKGGADAACIVAEGREYSRMTSSQIETIAKARESEARAKEDKIEPKSLSIVCPMLHGKEITEADWHDTVSNLVKTEESTREIEMPAQVEVVGGAKKSKLILKAWAEKEDALTGFYHCILDEIEKRINLKGYIDEPIIQNFIAGHYIAGHGVKIIDVGDKSIQTGTQVKDALDPSSNISAVTRKCPECGREVNANEKFCMDCGVKL